MDCHQENGGVRRIEGGSVCRARSWESGVLWRRVRRECSHGVHLKWIRGWLTTGNKQSGMIFWGGVAGFESQCDLGVVFEA